jgi:hypothetical protein
LFSVNPEYTAHGHHAAPFRQFVHNNYELANAFFHSQSQYEEELWRHSALPSQAR